jgi:hypothetical protein
MWQQRVHDVDKKFSIWDTYQALENLDLAGGPLLLDGI